MEYFSFIVLIGSLFVIAGGIHIKIRGRATPAKNVALLAIGGIAANFLGTTGASMLLIRPYLQVNRNRLRGFQVVFFIFIVSNIGGALIPMGLPFFLGYLMGVSFWWVFGYVWQMWIMTILILLTFFSSWIVSAHGGSQPVTIIYLSHSFRVKENPAECTTFFFFFSLWWR